MAVTYRVSWPDQEILWTTPRNLARDMEAKGINRQALILAGPGVAGSRGGPTVPSKLYDAAFSHGYRQAKEPKE